MPIRSIIGPSFTFFHFVRINPKSEITSPCPRSPNIMPNISIYVIATYGVGSMPVYDGKPYILTNISNGLNSQLFLSFVGGFILSSTKYFFSSITISDTVDICSLNFSTSLVGTKPAI